MGPKWFGLTEKIENALEILAAAFELQSKV
jgi:hypothetical protein